MTNLHDNPIETPAVTDIKARQRADLRIGLSRRQCQTEGNWCQSSQIAKEKSGVLHRYLDGASVRVTAASFYGHLISIASDPPRKVREPTTRFRRQPRERTAAELEGLRRGNEQRHRAAQARATAKNIETVD